MDKELLQEAEEIIRNIKASELPKAEKQELIRLVLEDVADQSGMYRITEEFREPIEHPSY